MRSNQRIPSIRLPRRRWQNILSFVVLVVAAVLLQWHPEWFGKPKTTPVEMPLENGNFRIARVIDGDTFVLTNAKEHVRLIGANTPETVKPDWPVEPWGPEASAFTKEFLAGGVVRLDFDAGERRDKYGRILAYASVGDRMLNEELIRAGLAKAETQYHYSADMKARFRRAETAAKSAKRGIWSDTVASTATKNGTKAKGK
jgi:micrococcal nuclease